MNLNRDLFIEQLAECLQGEVSQEEIAETLSFYREYFTEEEAKGKTEQEICTSLGSPRLIAHSIIDAHEEAVSGTTTGYYDAETDEYEDGSRGSNSSILNPNMKTLLAKGRTLVTILAVIVVGAFLFRLFLPVILIGVGIWAIRSLFRKNL